MRRWGMMRTTLPVYSVADLHAVGNALDDLASLLGGLRIGGRDVDAAVVLDVDLDAGIGDDLVDDLSAGADDFADLIGIDGEGDDLGRPLGQLLAGLGDALQHLAHDEHAAVVRLSQRLAQDGLVDALDLDIHLDGGDALLGARDLEVHVAQEVFQALNIGQHGDLAGLGVLDQAHGARPQRAS